MSDVYLINKEDGSLLPSEVVFREFYKTHGVLESVFDYWDETNIPVEDTKVDFPDFSKVIE